MHELRILHFWVSLEFGLGWGEREIDRLNELAIGGNFLRVQHTKKGFALYAQKSQEAAGATW